MPDDLTTRVARLLWAKLPHPHTCPDQVDAAARAVVKLVLDEAAKSVPQGWCLPETCRTEMDVTLAAAIQHVIRALGDKS